MKLLFTSVGRRVELMQAFRQAAERLEISLLIYGADVDDTAPALFFCDRVIQTCRIDEPDYIAGLLDICEKEHIDALIPTIDTDLLVLAQNKDMFQKIGTYVIINDEKKVQICNDKRLTARLFEECGLKTPSFVENVKDFKGDFPCFIKPVNGSSSLNAFRAENKLDLGMYANKISEYIIQSFIEGEEYTVDIFCDFDGCPIFITPRLRLAIRSGEVLKTRIEQDDRIIEECKQLINVFKPCGPITVQLIRKKDTGQDYYIEINPRFGGGAPLSMKAGADMAEVMLRLLHGERFEYKEKAAEDGSVFSRFDQSVRIKGKNTGRIRAVIFDLDDTLYTEKDYVKSGLHAVAQYLSRIPNAFETMWEAFELGEAPIDAVLSKNNVINEIEKNECLRTYRDHEPQICLDNEILQVLILLRKMDIKLGILTDGRPEGQRKKIKALGLEDLVDEIVITDELGGEIFRKPDDIAFRVMQRKMSVPFEQMLYVGDNLLKDFNAPIKLGMKACYLENANGLYYRKSLEDRGGEYSFVKIDVLNRESLSKILDESNWNWIEHQ